MEKIDSPYSVVVKHQKEVPVNLNAIANDLGLKVYEIDLGPQISGQIMRDRRRGGGSGFAIYVNAQDHPNRKRFTLAHEISHFILHRDLIEDGVIDDTMYRSQELSSQYEIQANRMAADILMPIQQVKKFMLLGYASDALANMFKVSKQAMEIRMQSIRV